MAEATKRERIKMEVDGTPPAVIYFHQYRNATSPEWSRPQRFTRYDRPEIQEPASYAEAAALTQEILAGWVGGTEMRVLEQVARVVGPTYRIDRPQGERGKFQAAVVSL